jgi:hypothetical protein
MIYLSEKQTQCGIALAIGDLDGKGNPIEKIHRHYLIH